MDALVTHTSSLSRTPPVPVTAARQSNPTLLTAPAPTVEVIFASRQPAPPSAVRDSVSAATAAGDRMFDFVIAMLAIVAFLPLFILVAIAIKLSAAGPVLFVQQRVGREGRMFPCLKFRTMVVDSEGVLERMLAECSTARAEWDADQKLRNDPRITAIGAILRKTSLDELPQLFNILFGHMSVVGPRPIVEAEISRYGPRFGAYCSVRPGLTGLWQVSGRNEVRYEARVRLDARYALRKSVSYDLGICFRTIPAVLASRGCY